MALYTITAGGTSNAVAASTNAFGDIATLETNKVVVLYVESSTLKAKIGTLSGTTWTWGTAATISSSVGSYDFNVCKAATDKFVAMYCPDTPTTTKAKACTVSGTTITVGSETTISSQTLTQCACCYISDDKVALASAWDSNSNSSLRVATLSGTTFTLGTEVTGIQGGYDVRSSALGIATIGTDKIVWRSGSDNQYSTHRVFTCTGTTTLTGGTADTFFSGTLAEAGVCSAGEDKFNVFATNQSNADYYLANTVSGTTVSNPGYYSAFSTTTTGDRYSRACQPGFSDYEFIVCNQKGSTTLMYAIAGDLQGTTKTTGTEVNLAGGDTGFPGGLCLVDGSDPTAAVYAFLYRNSSSYQTVQLLTVEFASTGASDNSLFFGNNF